MQITNDILTKTINNFKELYLSKKLILLEYYNSIIISLSQNSSNYISDLNDVLVDFKDVLDTANNCINNCDEILKLIEEENNNTQEIDKLFNEIIDFTTIIDTFMKNNLLEPKIELKQPISCNIKETIEVPDTSKISVATQEKEDEETKKETEEKSEEESKTETREIMMEELTDNNVLLISEKMNKVFLPYKICDLKKILKSNTTFKNLQELIDTKYIIPLNSFQNPVVSRFREAFSLIKDKDKRKCTFCHRIRIRTCF